MDEWPATLERQDKRMSNRWERKPVVGATEDVATYAYDSATRQAHLTKPRRYVSVEHAVQADLKAHAGCATARGMDPEAMLMRVDGGGSQEPRYDDMIDLKRAFLSAYRVVVREGARRGYRDKGHAQWLVWMDVVVERRTDEVGLRWVRTQHNQRVLHAGLQAATVKSHKTVKNWADDVSRKVEVALVEHSMWKAVAVDRGDT